MVTLRYQELLGQSFVSRGVSMFDWADEIRDTNRGTLQGSLHNQYIVVLLQKQFLVSEWLPGFIPEKQINICMYNKRNM